MVWFKISTPDASVTIKVTAAGVNDRLTNARAVPVAVIDPMVTGKTPLTKSGEGGKSTCKRPTAGASVKIVATAVRLEALLP